MRHYFHEPVRPGYATDVVVDQTGKPRLALTQNLDEALGIDVASPKAAVAALRQRFAGKIHSADFDQYRPRTWCVARIIQFLDGSDWALYETYDEQLTILDKNTQYICFEHDQRYAALFASAISHAREMNLLGWPGLIEQIKSLTFAVSWEAIEEATLSAKGREIVAKWQKEQVKRTTKELEAKVSSKVKKTE